MLMLWVLAADDVHVFAALPPDTLAAIAQLLHAAPHLHAAHLLLSERTRCCLIPPGLERTQHSALSSGLQRIALR